MSLEKVRKEISKTDAEIIRLIARRQELAGEVAKIKIHAGLPIHDEARTQNVLDDVCFRATESRIDPVSVREIFRILISMSEERQREFSGDGNLP